MIDDLAYNQGLARRVNAYWRERGVVANARVVPESYEYASPTAKGGTIRRTAFAIVSALTGMESCALPRAA